MRSTLLVVLVIGACGGGAQTAPPVTPPSAPVAPVAPVTPAKKSVSAEAVCERFAALKPRCKQLEAVDMSKDACIAQFKASASDPAEQASMDEVGRCFLDLDGCEEVMNCLQAASEKAAAKQPAQDTTAEEPDHPCDPKWATTKNRPMTIGAAGIPKAEWDKRNGAGVTAFKNAKSSKDKPIEMCGIPTENQWLTTLQCGDGSKPVTRANVETWRKGSLGTGGRCGSIIDLYSVKCPEASYDIYIDAYVCPAK
ncbi:MAG TPA: hypothetical protein VGO00_14505 [Kofleriaceae bacterium]|nr:hypothetical protein [Kofleriaceae bacterium]